VKPRSRWSDGYGADSVLPEGTPVRGFRPIEAFKAAVRYVRNTSTQAGRNAQIADTPQRFAQWVKSTEGAAQYSPAIDAQFA
jgi:hypothetical protein